MVVFLEKGFGCPKSCSKDMCNTGTDWATGLCVFGFTLLGAAATAGTATAGGAAVGAAVCGLASPGLKTTVCDNLDECDSPHNKEMRKNLEKALEGLKKVMEEIGDLKIGQEKLMSELIMQGKEFRKWFQKLDGDIQQIIQNQIENFKKIEQRFDALDEGQKNMIENQMELRNEFSKMQEMLVEQFAKNDEWFNKLDQNDQEILLGQKDILSNLYALSDRMERAQITLDSIEAKIDEGFLREYYKVDVKEITKAITLFSRLNRDEIGIFVEDTRYKLFIKYIVDDLRIEGATDNILKMMIGSTFPEIGSLYKLKRYCVPELHQKLRFLADEGMRYALFASRYASLDMAQTLDEFQENSIRADESYIEHCGCPSGYRPYKIKILSDLIPSLPPTPDPVAWNLQLILEYAKNPLQLKKARMLLDYRNYKPSPEVISRIDDFTQNDIQKAILMTQQNLTRWLEYHDGVTSCMQETSANFVGNEIYQVYAKLIKSYRLCNSN